jgi:hypothetical protein
MIVSRLLVICHTLVPTVRRDRLDEVYEYTVVPEYQKSVHAAASQDMSKRLPMPDGSIGYHRASSRIDVT